MARSLTSIPDIDQSILLMLPDNDLIKTCRLNRYFSQICQNDLFWRDRISVVFGSGYLISLPQGLTWRNYYTLIRKNQPDLVGDRLELDATHRAHRILTVEGWVNHESQLYHGLPLNLISAFRRRDRSMISYFMSQYNEVEAIEGYNSTFDYDSVLSTGVEFGFIPEVMQMIDSKSFQQYIEDDPDDLDKTGHQLGRHGLFDIFEQIKGETSFKISFIVGLIESGYIQESINMATQIIDELSEQEDYLDLYSKLLKASNFGQDPKFRRFLETKFVSTSGNVSQNYVEIYTIAALEAGRFDLGLPNEDMVSPRQVFEALSIHNPDLALLYAKEGKEDISNASIKSSNLTLLRYCWSNHIQAHPDELTSSPETILAYYQELEYPAFSVLLDALTAGRYDLIPYFDTIVDIIVKTRSISMKTLFFNLNNHLSTTSYKDIIVWLYLWQRDHNLEWSTLNASDYTTQEIQPMLNILNQRDNTKGIDILKSTLIHRDAYL